MKPITQLSNKQRKVMKVLKAGGEIRTQQYKRNRKYRMMDVACNPLENLHGRTFAALLKKGLIHKKDNGAFSAIVSGKK